MSVGCIFLSLYVDDMIITSDDCDNIESINPKLTRHFAMKS